MREEAKSPPLTQPSNSPELVPLPAPMQLTSAGGRGHGIGKGCRYRRHHFSDEVAYECLWQQRSSVPNWGQRGGQLRGSWFIPHGLQLKRKTAARCACHCTWRGPVAWSHLETVACGSGGGLVTAHDNGLLLGLSLRQLPVEMVECCMGCTTVANSQLVRLHQHPSSACLLNCLTARFMVVVVAVAAVLSNLGYLLKNLLCPGLSPQLSFNLFFTPHSYQHLCFTFSPRSSATTTPWHCSPAAHGRLTSRSTFACTHVPSIRLCTPYVGVGHGAWAMG